MASIAWTAPSGVSHSVSRISEHASPRELPSGYPCIRHLWIGHEISHDAFPYRRLAVDAAPVEAFLTASRVLRTRFRWFLTGLVLYAGLLAAVTAVSE